MEYNYFAHYGQVLYYRVNLYGGLWLIDLGQLRMLNYLVSPAVPKNQPVLFFYPQKTGGEKINDCSRVAPQ